MTTVPVPVELISSENAPALPVTAAPFPDMPPPFALRAGLALKAKLERLLESLMPAEVAIFTKATGLVGTMAVGKIAKLGIADLLADGPKTADELAAATHTHADTLHRTLRGLANQGIFELLPDGRFRNNRLSNALRATELHQAKRFAEYFASTSNVHAWADFETTLRTGKSGFDRVHGMNVWDWFDRHPDERACFADAMFGITTHDAPTVSDLYPFEQIRRLCDVGGGRGTLLSELLVRHPHLEGVLCDAPGVLEGAKVLLRARGVEGRVTLAPGSFFDHVPAGADAYVLKNILHDWDDATCGRILKNVRAAMGAGARLLVVETITERNDADGIGPMADLQMMMACQDGRERGVGEFRRLMENAGFRLERVFPAPTVSVLEGVAV